MAGSLVPDVGNVSINTTGALNNLMKAYDNFGTELSSPVDRLEKYAKEDELKARLEKEDALKAEALAYTRANDLFYKNRLMDADKISQEERDYLLGQRKNKEDFMKSVSEPGYEALDDTIMKRTNDLAASKWNEANPISDADAAKLNDYYVKNQKILNPTLDPENLRSYIGAQALKYGVDPTTATSTYEMFKPDKKETGLTDMEKLLISSELKKQEDVNRLNTEKALGNEKYDGKSGSSSSSRKNKDGSNKNIASVIADAAAIKTEDSWLNAIIPFVQSESEDVRDLAQDLYNKNYDGDSIIKVLKGSVVNGKLDEDRLEKVLKDVPIKVSKSDTSSTGALESVEYQPAIDLQSMIAKSTKVDKGQLAEDMFEREFGIPKGKSGVSYSRPTSGAVDNYVPKSLPKEYESAYSSLIGKEGTDTKGKYVGYGQFEEKTATPYLQQLGKTWSDFKSDPYLQKEITAMHMVDNAERLKNNDIEPNDTNLYMVHNLGEPTALKVLKGKALDTSDYHKILNQLSNKEIGVELPRFANTAENKEKGVVGQIDITKAKSMVKTGELPAFDNIDASALWMNKFGKKNDYIENVSKEPFDVSKKDTIDQAIVDRFQEINKLYGKDSQKAIEEKAKAKEEINRTFKLRDLMNSTSKAPDDGDEVIKKESNIVDDTNLKQKNEFEDKIYKIRAEFNSKKNKLYEDLRDRFKNGELSYLDNTLSKIGKQKEQRNLESEEDNVIRDLIKLNNKNGTRLTKYEQDEYDAKEYDRKENESSLLKKQKQMFINELKTDPSIIEEYNNSWKSEARKRGLIGTNIRPFSISEFINSLTPERIKEIRNR